MNKFLVGNDNVPLFFLTSSLSGLDLFSLFSCKLDYFWDNSVNNLVDNFEVNVRDNFRNNFGSSFAVNLGSTLETILWTIWGTVPRWGSLSRKNSGEISCPVIGLKQGQFRGPLQSIFGTILE